MSSHHRPVDLICYPVALLDSELGKLPLALNHFCYALANSLDHTNLPMVSLRLPTFASLSAHIPLLIRPVVIAGDMNTRIHLSQYDLFVVISGQDKH